MSNVELPRMRAGQTPGSGLRILVVVGAALVLGALLGARAGNEPPDYPGAMAAVEAAAPTQQAAR
jgi:hypothetical protein